MDLRRRRQRREFLISSLTAMASLVLAWWLFDLAGYRPFGSSVSQWFCFVLCYLGIERIVSTTVDFLVIAFEPRNGQAPRAT